MKNRILVGYASKNGATAEIAAKIGEILLETGLPVDVKPVSQVPSLDEYQAVVLGSAVYVGQWRKEAATFLKTNEEKLTEIPVCFFPVGRRVRVIQWH